MQAEQNGLRPWLEVYPIEEKTQGLAPEQVFFVDIGGGVGHQAVGVKEWLPKINNEILLQDQEVVVPHALKHDGVKAMAYDFFQPQPVKGIFGFFQKSSWVLLIYMTRCSNLLHAQHHPRLAG
jgi:demethylsterigmatocystin 6-O-methyltransferase